VDPNLMHVDWERTGEALTFVVILSFFIERALAVVFENQFWVRTVTRSGVKEFVAVAASVWVCATWKLDAVSMIVLTEENKAVGYVLTGLVIAGGSKASIKLFHDVLNVESQAQATRHPQRAEQAAAEAEALEFRAREVLAGEGTKESKNAALRQLHREALVAVQRARDALLKARPADVPAVERAVARAVAAAGRIRGMIQE